MYHAIGVVRILSCVSTDSVAGSMNRLQYLRLTGLVCLQIYDSKVKVMTIRRWISITACLNYIKLYLFFLNYQMLTFERCKSVQNLVDLQKLKKKHWVAKSARIQPRADL